MDFFRFMNTGAFIDTMQKTHKNTSEDIVQQGFQE
jgi:hypothetical protein